MLDAFATYPATAPVAQVEAAPASDADRARKLMFALASAEATYDALGSSLKRALGYERRVLDRQPGRVRTETRIALREAKKLLAQLEAAAAALPVEG